MVVGQPAVFTENAERWLVNLQCLEKKQKGGWLT